MGRGQQCKCNGQNTAKQETSSYSITPIPVSVLHPRSAPLLPARAPGLPHSHVLPASAPAQGPFLSPYFPRSCSPVGSVFSKSTLVSVPALSSSPVAFGFIKPGTSPSLCSVAFSPPYALKSPSQGTHWPG